MSSSTSRSAELLRLHGAAIRRDAALSALLETALAAAGRTFALMERTGVVAACTACAARTPGGCCFPEIAPCYDETLLLVNRLAGADLDEESHEPASCRFCGPRGCRLRARYGFCVTYLCPDLATRLGPETVARLSATAGAELWATFELERALAAWLRDRA